MELLPGHFVHFVSTRVLEALCKTQKGEQALLIEVRQSADEKETYFTVADGQEVRAPSIHHLVQLLPDLVSLTLPHAVSLLWNGTVKNATLIEILRRSSAQPYPLADVTVRLSIEGELFETTPCDALQDAIWELHELSDSQWRLRTCYHCILAGLARDYLNTDRWYWCYRDVPDAIEEILTKGRPESSRWLGA